MTIAGHFINHNSLNFHETYNNLLTMYIKDILSPASMRGQKALLTLSLSKDI